jgi:hypothetical protein
LKDLALKIKLALYYNMNNATRNAQTRRQRCYANNCPLTRPLPNGTSQMIPMAERNACIRTCLEEFPYTPYELEMQRRREAWRLATQSAAAAANAAAARAAANAAGQGRGGGKNRKSRKTRRRSIRR